MAQVAPVARRAGAGPDAQLSLDEERARSRAPWCEQTPFSGPSGWPFVDGLPGGGEWCKVPSVTAFDVTELAPGTILLEKYEIIETLGVGGMGAVVAAHHLHLDTKVAIKFMLPDLVSNEQVVKRFLLEARAATKIHSDHVARVIDVGSMTGEGLPEEGVPYMVMEFLDGLDLSQWVATGKRFPVLEAIDFTVQAAEALAQAHKVGIVHRDVKPANLFLAEYPEAPSRVKVLDFGISKITSEEPAQMGLTKTTTVLGSGLYMSPEQMRSAKKVDHRTDIYALGVTLYELLTGTQPFTAETFSELCVKVNIDDPTPLHTYRPDIAPELAAVIAKAYAREVDDRFQTMGEFVAALGPFAAAESVPVINNIQGLTQPGIRPLASSIPPPNPHALVGTAGAVTATAEMVKTKQSSVTLAFGIALIALLVVGGAGFLFIQSQNNATPTPGQSNAVVTTVTVTVTTTATAAPPPIATTGGSGGQGGDGGSGGAGGAPTATPTATRVRPPRPPVTATATATATSTRPCFKKDPTTGLKVPCHLIDG